MPVSAEAFDLSALDQSQRSLITEVLERCDFDFRLCLPRLKSEKGRDRIPVTFEDLSSYGARSTGGETHTHEGTYHIIAYREQVLGLAYYSGKVVIHSSLSHSLTQEVFMAEVAHMVDFFYMNPEQRKSIFHLFHKGDVTPHEHGWFEETGNNDYWSWVGEAFMGGFTLAYSDLAVSMTGFTHQLTRGEAQGIRDILGGVLQAPPEGPPSEPEPDAPEPEPVPEPVDPKVCENPIRHSPTYGRTVRHHIKPKMWGGDDSDENTVRCCDNDHYHAHVLIDRALKLDRWLTRDELRGVSRWVRRIAKQGYDQRPQNAQPTLREGHDWS